MQENSNDISNPIPNSENKNITPDSGQNQDLNENICKNLEVLNDNSNQDLNNDLDQDSSIGSTFTNAQKWWLSILLGFVFAIISSPLAYYLTSTITTSLGGLSMIEGHTLPEILYVPNLVGLAI